MVRSWSAILLVLVVAAHAVLGGFRADGAILCLGGGCDHAREAAAPAAAEAHHDGCCAHEETLAAPVSHVHSDTCPCIDVDLARSDLGCPREESTVGAPASVPAHAACVRAATTVIRSGAAWTEPGVWRRQCASAIRSTRLLM